MTHDPPHPLQRASLALALLASAAARSNAQGVASPATGATAASQATFSILEYRVLGGTILQTRTIERAVYSHLGPGRTIADVQAARADLEKAYRDAGYSTVYVDIPEQKVDDGIVRLHVTEGRLEHVRVSGTRYFSNRHILGAVPSLKEGTVPAFPEVQQELSRLNQESPDLKVAPVLRPGSEPGTMAVDLKVKDDLPLHASVEVNDRYTADTTHTRLVYNLSYSNLFQSFHTLSFQYQMAPAHPADSSVFAATYALPIGSSGDALSLLAIRTDSDVATVGTLAVLGKGHIYGAHYTVLLPGSGGYYSSLTLGGDYKDFAQNVLLQDGGGLRTPINYLNWSAVYAASIPKARTAFDVDLDFGARGLVNRSADFENNRYLAKPNYLYLRLNGTTDQPLLFGSHLALRISSQYTTEPLINNEQFALGGVESVRGYLEAEELGDIGASGSLELRSPSLSTLFGMTLQQAYIYSFGDAGVASLIDPLPQQPGRVRQASWGVGLRLVGFGGLEASLDWANPRVSSSNVNAGDSRIDFRVRYGR